MNTTIDFDSRIPLYAQLEEILSNAVRRGDLEPGQFIPSEEELCARYGVSRITVRRSLESLVREGLLTRLRGKGTRINPPRFIDDTINLQSFTEKTGHFGGNFSTRVLERNFVEACGRIAGHMGIEEGERLVYVRRLRIFNGEPIGLFENYLRASIGLGLEENFEGSVYALMEQKYGIVIKEAKREMSAILADKETAGILKVERPFALFSVRTYSYDTANRVMEYSEGVYRTDRYEFITHQGRIKGSA